LPRLSAAHARVASAGASAPEIIVDRELSFGELSHAHAALKRLAPFGIGNEKPLFLFQNISITGVKAFGKQQNHLGATFEQRGKRVEGVSFFSTPESFQARVSPGERADVVGHVESDWRGQPRIRIVDVL
jgi:single-stranded-DNA-specific exonuclease